MRTIIIAENLVNDYCGVQPKFLNNHINIGLDEIERLMGSASERGKGPLPEFLRHQIKAGSDILFFRDLYEDEHQIASDHLDRFGEHCIANSPGSDFPVYFQDIVEKSKVIDCKGLSLPLHIFRSQLLDLTGVDVLSENEIEEKRKFRFLVVGFHTERRVFITANTLRNLFGFPNVAVFTHFVTGFTKEAHFTTLRYSFPDNLVKVLNGIEELEDFLEQKPGFLDKFNLHSAKILPAEISLQLNEEQKKIIESICMHWTEVNLKPLSGGFSGSALFLANGKQGRAKTEPMVIKIDKHDPIRNEIRGYNLVKDFLGKHIPTFTFPVSLGSLSGIGMELASMEGAPATLQDYFEKATDDYGIDDFIKLLTRVLELHSNRVYSNTVSVRNVAPFRHFMLHISEQSNWLRANIENIFRHKTDKVIISEDIILSIFNLIRKNTDAIPSEMCIGHGDLNLANVIVDVQENLWTIDWTHANYHPLEIDFAKMENDIKFVLCKEIDFEDLPKLKEMEDYLLENMVPSEVQNIPDHLNFIKWDNRFKKIYKGVRALRLSYSKLKEGSNWLIYKISLLKYALHTLSFDETIDQGECSPPQLWHVLLSVESLCFQLVADDYHLQIRSERPNDYPERQRIQIDLANWRVDAKNYNPPYYVSPEILNKSSDSAFEKLFDSEDQWQFDDFIDWGTKYQRDQDGKPLNPRGRTGIAGRGSLWFWGNNPMLFVAPIRYREGDDEFEVLLNSESDQLSLTSVHFRRNESIENAMKRAKFKLGFDLDGFLIDEVREGYLYDPRQTDNAWVEAKSFLLFSKVEGVDEIKEVAPGLDWKVIDPRLINTLYSSQGNILRECVQYIHDTKNIKEKFVVRLLQKTG
ncbi:MAG: hypothetical protein ACI840_001189 [Ulvibacter sp.]|jgi:hypothetical protein